MFNSANLYYLAFLDLLIILVIYILVSWVWKFTSREDVPGEKDSKWLLLLHKYHLFKVMNLVVIFLFISLNLRILNETIFSSSTDLNKFIKLHAWIVGNGVIAMFIFIDRIALFKKKTVVEG
jgi:hypothetical protein